jgi:hypothetical protein
MSKRVTAMVRKAPKGRNLRPGEYYDEVKKRDKYRYRDENNKYHDVYAFRLTDKDPVPYDKPEKGSWYESDSYQNPYQNYGRENLFIYE